MRVGRNRELSSVIDQFHIHDARELTELLPAAKPCIDLTATSPPYWNLKDYGVPNQIGFDQPKDKFLNDIESVLRLVLEVTKDTGSLWLVVGTYRERTVLRLLPFELAEVAERAGWQPREMIIWDKQHSVPWVQKGQLRNLAEYILVFSKTPRYKYYLDRIRTIDEISKWWVDFPERFHPKGKAPSDIWHFPIRTQGAWNRNARIRHLCPFPTALAARIIEVATDPGDTVLDPFAGSGVLLAQAEVMGRHYIGLDINPDYAKMFETVVRHEVAAEWQQLQNWREIAESARGEFQQTIVRLRALKYTRKVANVFFDALRPGSGDKHPVKAVICLANIPTRHVYKQPVEVAIIIVMNGDHPNGKIAVARAEEIMRQAPLSHFGIEATLEVCSSDETVRRLGKRRRLYLYPRHKPRKHCGYGSLSKWLTGDWLAAKDLGRVPVLANFGVDVSWVLKD